MEWEKEEEELNLSNIRPNHFWTRFNKRELLLILTGAGLVILILIFMLSNPSHKKPTQTTQNSYKLEDGVNERIQSIESKISNLEQEIIKLKADLNSAPSTNQTIEVDNGLKVQVQELSQKIDKIEEMVKSKSVAGKTVINSSSAKTKASSKKSNSSLKTKCYHTVKAGETLYRIGKKYKIALDRLRKENGLNENSKIYPGQKLKVCK